MFSHLHTRDNPEGLILVHVEDANFKGVNDLRNFPIVLQIDTLSVYLTKEEAERLAALLNQALLDLDLRKVSNE